MSTADNRGLLVDKRLGRRARRLPSAPIMAKSRTNSSSIPHILRGPHPRVRCLALRHRTDDEYPLARHPRLERGVADRMNAMLSL